jgi:exodeoxyribonuclease VII small subunit
MAKSVNVDNPVTLEALVSGDVREEQIASLSFEQALTLLEEVVTSVESGNLPLERAIGSYEKGTGLVQHLRNLLSRAEEKLRILNAAQESLS